MAKSDNAPHYSKEDIKNWIQFGIANGYVNQYKKDQIIKWVQLFIKNAVVILELNRSNVYR